MLTLDQEKAVVLHAFASGQGNINRHTDRIREDIEYALQRINRSFEGISVAEYDRILVKVESLNRTLNS